LALSSNKTVMDDYNYKDVLLTVGNVFDKKILVGNENYSLLVKNQNNTIYSVGDTVTLKAKEVINGEIVADVEKRYNEAASNFVLETCGVICYDEEKKMILLSRNINTNHFIFEVKIPLFNFLKGNRKNIDVKIMCGNIETWNEDEFNDLSDWNLGSLSLFKIKPRLTKGEIKRYSSSVDSFRKQLTDEMKQKMPTSFSQIFWSIPKGNFKVLSITSVETPVECAIRETKEESGVDLKISELDKVYTQIASPNSSILLQRFYCVSRTFSECSTYPKESPSKIEISQWFSVQEAVKHLHVHNEQLALHIEEKYSTY